jgi:hypothetical protein
MAGGAPLLTVFSVAPLEIAAATLQILVGNTRFAKYAVFLKRLFWDPHNSSGIPVIVLTGLLVFSTNLPDSNDEDCK